MSSPDAEVRLYDSPTDSISSLNFNSDGSRLLCSAWDSKLRLYNVDKESFLVPRSSELLSGSSKFL